jgi:ribosomal protein S27E
MTIIKADCPSCGEIDLQPSGVDLQWCSHAPASFYRFTCPGCAEVVTKHADGGVAQLLISAGVRPTLWHLPEELNEIRGGPAFTLDDVIDFHVLLETEDWFDALRAIADGQSQAAA